MSDNKRSLERKNFLPFTLGIMAGSDFQILDPNRRSCLAF
jgi:hypothetical protein